MTYNTKIAAIQTISSYTNFFLSFFPSSCVLQHLLVDIKGIEADFLDSEVRLAKAMVDTVNNAGLTMLSYHCHKLIPKGVSCVGVLLESHISFHTWPGKFMFFRNSNSDFSFFYQKYTKKIIHFPRLSAFLFCSILFQSEFIHN
jgi:hypothetical protein